MAHGRPTALDSLGTDRHVVHVQRWHGQRQEVRPDDVMVVVSGMKPARRRLDCLRIYSGRTKRALAAQMAVVVGEGQFVAMSHAHSHHKVDGWFVY